MDHKMQVFYKYFSSNQLGSEEAQTFIRNKLKERDRRKHEIVMLRYYAGLSIDETARALEISPRTVDNEWRFTKVWLHREGSPVSRPSRNHRTRCAALP